MDSSKVYAADVFYSEFEENILDTGKVQRYRQSVLEGGGSTDGIQNLTSFLGREPSTDAFYKSLLFQIPQ
jgi:metallopeptidase MepB